MIALKQRYEEPLQLLSVLREQFTDMLWKDLPDARLVCGSTLYIHNSRIQKNQPIEKHTLPSHWNIAIRVIERYKALELQSC